MLHRTILSAITISIAISPSALDAAETTQAVNYSREIQPILAKRCYQCHGPSAAEGGLRLDSRDAAIAELESGSHAIVPGEIASSVILERLRSNDETVRMPPEGEPLDENEIRVLERWIQQAAPWNAHWAFETPKQAGVTPDLDPDWGTNPIDAFLLRQLRRTGLKPAQTADRVTLIRRAYYDLIGLPPSPEEVDAFLADDSDEAFEKVVDHLLDSPQYGEKWARHWLDVVRYAETNGYERDAQKDLIWRYRDYVIRAFNTDKPYDEFIIEQLAGDELPDSNADSIIATGFYRLGLWDDEPVDPRLARYDYLDDILRTTSEAFLGMTIGCARCHDHKIDPISQRDYYSMLAFLMDISPHGKANYNHVPITSPEERVRFAAQESAKAVRERELRQQIGEIEDDFRARWRNKFPDVEIASTSALKDSVLTSVDDGQTWKYSFERPPQNWYEIAFNDTSWLQGLGGFGKASTPESHVRTEWNSSDVWLRRDFRLGEIPESVTLEIHHDENAEIYLNGQLVAERKGYLKRYESIDISAACADVLQTGRNTLAVHCHQTAGDQYIDVGLTFDNDLNELERFVRDNGDGVFTPEQLNHWKTLKEQLQQSESQELKFRETYAMAVAESGRHRTYVLHRGIPAAEGDEVQPAFPQTLRPPSAEIPITDDDAPTTGKRLALARWIASPNNPLTARVAVNRIWQHHFGRGLVRTSSDFGFQGTAPSHPELLDWLAQQLVSHGWRLKPMHKLIMLSDSYRMTSAGNTEAFQLDPANNHFWRFNARRLTAEELRDSVLAVSDVLNNEMYGPSIYPPLPAEVLATASRPDAAWGKSSPEQAVRRSIYVHVKRSLRHPMLANFDSPDTDTSCAARITTTVPTQALEMMNGPFMAVQSAKFAARLEREAPGDVVAQVRRAMRLTTSREPTQEEIQADVMFLEQLTKQEGLSTHEALRNLCLVMLNANEFVYLD